MAEEEEMDNRSTGEEEAAEACDETTLSALEHNIESKGKNAYYFAHSHKATGPQWDGKREPKLLSKQSSELSKSVKSSFDIHKSTLTSYAFEDQPAKVKLYIEMEGVGDKCSDDDITLDWTETTLNLVVKNFEEQDQTLCFAKLTDTITDASYKLKTNRIILTLNKQEEKEWLSINDKGTPDYAVV